MLMLKNVRLIDPATKTDGIRDILIAEKKIIRIAPDLFLEADLIARAKGERLEKIDCSGLVAAPGLVDVHVHFRDPGYTYKEDILSGSRAAAAGGYTTVICMANTNPPIDSEEGIVHVLMSGRHAPIRVRTCATITKGMQGTELVDMKLLRECGAAGFTDDGKPILSEELSKEAMLLARKCKAPLSFHEEDPKYIKEAGINHGSVSEKLGIYGADRQAEISLIKRDIRLAGETGATISIQHISTKEGVELVRKAKKSGIHIWAEATPHHFSLTEDAVDEFGTLAKVNPPLRTNEDRLAIIEGLKDRTIDIIATDHAPHSVEEKAKPLLEAPSGMIGLETALSLAIMNLVKPGHLKLSQVIERMSYYPSKLYNIDAGILREDESADIVIFDPSKEWTYEKSRSKSQNSPWLGKRLTGKVIMTICAGSIEYDARNEN